MVYFVIGVEQQQWRKWQQENGIAVNANSNENHVNGRKFSEVNENGRRNGKEQSGTKQ